MFVHARANQPAHVRHGRGLAAERHELVSQIAGVHEDVQANGVGIGQAAAPKLVGGVGAALACPRRRASSGLARTGDAVTAAASAPTTRNPAFRHAMGVDLAPFTFRNFRVISLCTATI